MTEQEHLECEIQEYQIELQQHEFAMLLKSGFPNMNVIM